MPDRASEMPEEGVRRKHPSRLALALAVVVALLLALAAAVFVLYGRGGGPLPGFLARVSARPVDPLSASSPEEQVLRTLRLAGYDKASVGTRGSTVVVRLSAPSVRTASEVTLAWETAVTAVSAAYPKAGTIVAQLFSEGRPMLQVEVTGEHARDAIAGRGPSPAGTLQQSAKYTFLTGEGSR